MILIQIMSRPGMEKEREQVVDAGEYEHILAEGLNNSFAEQGLEVVVKVFPKNAVNVIDKSKEPELF